MLMLDDAAVAAAFAAYDIFALLSLLRCHAVIFIDFSLRRVDFRHWFSLMFSPPLFTPLMLWDTLYFLIYDIWCFHCRRFHFSSSLWCLMLSLPPLLLITAAISCCRVSPFSLRFLAFLAISPPLMLLMPPMMPPHYFADAFRFSSPLFIHTLFIIFIFAFLFISDAAIDIAISMLMFSLSLMIRHFSSHYLFLLFAAIFSSFAFSSCAAMPLSLSFWLTFDAFLLRFDYANGAAAMLWLFALLLMLLIARCVFRCRWRDAVTFISASHDWWFHWWCCHDDYALHVLRLRYYALRFAAFI